MLTVDTSPGTEQAIAPDPGLPRQMQIVRSVLFATKARLYVVAIDRSIEQNRIPGGSSLPYPPRPSAGGSVFPYGKLHRFPLQLHKSSNNWRKTSGGHMYRRLRSDQFLPGLAVGKRAITENRSTGLAHVVV
jgi:hypothetical protein